MKALQEMTVLVTGGSKGIGAAIVERFATIGMNIAIVYHTSHESANDVARRCMNLGSRVMTFAADVTQREQLQRVKEKLELHGMQPDIIVNNAGVAHYGLITDVTDEEWDHVMNVNLRGLFLTTQVFMEHMVRQKYGRIINVSSIWGMAGAACEVVYSTSKGGVNAFTKALAKELAPSGVTVNAVAPGVVETEMMKQFDESEKTQICHDIPAGRFGQPEEIASLVYFLALPESSYINGQIISPNGGWHT